MDAMLLELAKCRPQVLKPTTPLFGSIAVTIGTFAAIVVSSTPHIKGVISLPSGATSKLTDFLGVGGMRWKRRLWTVLPWPAPHANERRERREHSSGDVTPSSSSSQQAPHANGIR